MIGLFTLANDYKILQEFFKIKKVIIKENKYYIILKFKQVSQSKIRNGIIYENIVTNLSPKYHYIT